MSVAYLNGQFLLIAEARISVLDRGVIGDGVPGPVAKRLRQLYLDFARRTAV